MEKSFCSKRGAEWDTYWGEKVFINYFFCLEKNMFTFFAT